MSGYYVNGTGTDGSIPAGGSTGDTLGFTGGAPLWIDPAGELSVLGIETVYDFAAAEGWTTRDGGSGSTAQITGGVARCIVPTGASLPIASTAPNITRPAPQGGMGYRVVARLAAYGNPTTDTMAGVGVSETAVGAATGTTTWVGAVVLGDGTVEAYVDVNSPPSASAASALPVDGTGWVCVESVAGHAAVYYGTGTTSAEPLDWQRLYTGPRAVPFGSDRAIGLFAASSSALGADCTVDWDLVRVRAL